MPASLRAPRGRLIAAALAVAIVVPGPALAQSASDGDPRVPRPMAPADAAPRADHVVLISVDGFRPDFYRDPAWPAVMLRRMAQEGAHAAGVRGVHPSVTYPSHTTLVTGAMPARHGIHYNSPFEPAGQTGAWYWKADGIRVPTIWDAVREAGGTTAALWWPVTVGAAITWNVPEIWPLDDAADRTAALRAATTPRDFLAELELRAVEPMDDRFRGALLSRDDRMAAMATYTLRVKQPALMLVHFTTTDSHQHSYGREHHLVERAVQTVDRGIARIVEAAEEAGILDRTTFIVTGDHGFSDIHTQLAPNVWLAEAGLTEDRPDRGSWRATFHVSGASAFLMLRNPRDTAAVRMARAAVDARPPAVQRLFMLIDREAMVAVGADPSAPFSISGVDGVSMSSAASGAAVRAGRGGTHGHYPGFANMETGFVAWGAGIRGGARLSTMSLADIAPVVTALLDVPFVAPDGVLLPGLLAPTPARTAATPAPAAPDATVPAAVSSATPDATDGPHNRAFATADALAAYLDPRTGAGPLVSAHRGGPGAGYPANAIPTFQRALAAGPMLIELDVRRSADGALVVLHDDDVSRTTLGRGTVGRLTLAALQRLRLRDPDGTPTEARVPSLADAFAWADGRAVLRLDVKSGVTVAHVVAAIRAADATNRAMVIARTMDEVRSYQRLLPDLVLSFWYDPDRNGQLSMDEAAELLAMPLDRSRLIVGVGSIGDGWDPAALALVQQAGVRGMVSTFGTLDQAALSSGGWEGYCPLVQARVGVIITDAAAAAARAVRDCPASGTP